MGHPNRSAEPSVRPGGLLDVAPFLVVLDCAGMQRHGWAHRNLANVVVVRLRQLAEFVLMFVECLGERVSKVVGRIIAYINYMAIANNGGNAVIDTAHEAHGDDAACEAG